MNIRFFLFLISLFFILPLSANAAMLDYPSVKLRTLDKATARTNTIEVKVGDTVQFGSLFIKVQACRESDPLDKPESASFLQIWEVPINSDKSEWIFSGWMFASSPALSAMDHAVYDVWVLECTGGQKASIKPSKSVQIGDGEESGIEETAVEGEAVEEALEPEIKEELAPIQEISPVPTEKTIESVIDDVVSDDVNYE